MISRDERPKSKDYEETLSPVLSPSDGNGDLRSGTKSYLSEMNPFKSKRFVYLPLLVSAGCTLLILWRMDFALVAKSFEGLKIRWVLVMAAVYLAGFLLRGLRWHLMLLPIKRISPRITTEGVVIGYMANNLLPARAGEIIRAVSLGGRESISRASALGTIAVERLFDGLVILGILIVCFVLFSSVNTRTGMVVPVILIASGVFALASLVLLLGCYRSAWIRKGILFLSRKLPPLFSQKVNEAGSNLLDSLRFLKSGRQVQAVILLSVSIWMLEGLVFWAGLAAFEFDRSLLKAYFTLALVNMALLIPSGPGGVGVFEQGNIFAFSLFGISAEPALCYSLVVHAVMVVPITVWGLVILGRYGLSIDTIRGQMPSG